jgi:hypothetical protein
MHVFLFGVIRILEEMKTLSSSFAGRQPAADAADGWFVAPHFGMWALFPAREKAVFCKELSTLKSLACSFQSPA